MEYSGLKVGIYDLLGLFSAIADDKVATGSRDTADLPLKPFEGIPQDNPLL